MNISIEERLWRGVLKGPECWLWQRAVNNKGYGLIGTSRRKLSLVHRLSWTLAHGEIPPGMSVLHTCDVPRCVRPSHLFLGTQLDNMRDCNAKGRHTHKCKLTPDAVRAMRARYANGETIATLARAFTISQPVAHSVVHRNAWKHIA